MGQIIRCPLVGTPCMKEIIIQDKTFFLAEAEKPEDDRKRRIQAINESIGDGYEIRSALDEKGINAFTCKICEMIQTCAYGIADITSNNPNVLFELGIMIALGKATLILLRKDQEIGLKLPSDLNAIEVIPFTEYIDTIDQLRAIVPKLPPPISPPSPIKDLEKIQPQFAEEIRGMEANIVREFKSSIEEAKLDTISLREEKKEIPAELSERIAKLEEMLKELAGLGFTTDAKTAFLRGNYYYNQGKYSEALASYDWSLQLKLDHIGTLNNLGNTYFKLERYEEALDDFNHALELKPDDPDILNNRGLTFSNLQRHEDALADFNRALELRPDDPTSLHNRGFTYGKLERHEEALADFNRALELRPDDHDTLYSRGAVYYKLKKYEQALANVNRFLELRPDNPDALNSRGLTYYELRRYDEALTDYDRSLELRPDDPDTLNNRGITYSYLQRYDDALADYSRALQLKPDDAGTLYNLACLFSLWGKVDEALDNLEKAIKGDEKYREMAKTDKDFDNIRDNPHFKKLMESD